MNHCCWKIEIEVHCQHIVALMAYQGGSAAWELGMI